MLPAVLHILRGHLPFPTLVVMVASLECAVRIADAVRMENKARRVTTEVYGHIVLFVKPIQPATQALTATTAARDTIPAESIFLNGNFDAVEIPGYLAIWPYGNDLLALSRIVVDVILRWWNQFLHIQTSPSKLDFYLNLSYLNICVHTKMAEHVACPVSQLYCLQTTARQTDGLSTTAMP